MEHPNFSKEFNAERLPEYLAFEYIPDEGTLFKNVNKLLSGHCLIYENGKLSIKQYFDYNFNIDSGKEIDHWVDLIEKNFSESVKLHRRAGVEVGCFLSSGVDSSYVAAEMVKEKKMRAFSVGFAEEKISELPYAKEYAKSLGIEFISRTVSAREFFDIAPTVQYQMDEPLPNPSALPLYFLSQLASKELKTVLSGEGSDELFGGYSYYKEPLEFENYQKLPQALRNLLAKAVKPLPAFKGKKFIMRGSLPIEKRFIRNHYVFSDEERKGLLPNFGPMKEAWVFNKPYFDKVKGLDDITKMQYVDLHSWALFDIMQKAD
ncbi:MAG TPA: asparagine synthase-related protein, partial [Candidatus Woesebacteria bacterium]|nr:asparagine synthase-related protein [Candidatus Woesebacteria bacterium]